MAGLFGLEKNKEHRFAAENLSAYMDDALSARDKQRVERHLAGCVQCEQDLLSLRQTRAVLRRAPLRPVPRSFTLPRAMQPEQARFRRWTATYSFLRLATSAVTLMLIILLSGDVLLGMGILPAPAQARPTGQAAVERQAAPGDLGTPSAPAQPTVASGQEAPLSQAAPEAVPAEPSVVVAAAPQEQKEAPRAMAAPSTEEPGPLAAQKDVAAPSASSAALMAPKRAAASPEEPTAQAVEATAQGVGGGEPAEARQAPTEAPTPAPLPTEAPPTVPLPTVAPTATSKVLALGSEEQQPAVHDAPAAGGVVSEHSVPVSEVRSTLRLLWIGMMGLLFMLLAALLWAGTKRRA